MTMFHLKHSGERIGLSSLLPVGIAVALASACSSTSPTSTALIDPSQEGGVALTSASTAFIATADFGADTVTVRSGASFGTIATIPVGSDPRFVASGDMDGAGDTDLVVADGGDDTVSVVTGNGSGSFTVAGTFSVGDGPNSVALADLDGDGDLDVVTANSNGGSVSVLSNNGSGSLSTSATLSASRPAIADIGDVTGDGDPDIVVVRDRFFISDRVTIFENNGSGGFPSSCSLTTGDRPRNVDLGLLDGDSTHDIVVSNTNDDDVRVWLGGSGICSASSTDFAVGDDPRGLAVGDATGDGNDDVVTGNINSETVTILPGNGSGGFGPTTTIPSTIIGSFPAAITIGDASGDGNPDVITANFNDSNVIVVNGTGFTTSDTYAVGAEPFSVVFDHF